MLNISLLHACGNTAAARLALYHICNATAGITEFIDTALDKGAAIGLLAGTCSIPEEQILTAALFALGDERTQQLHTFVCSPRPSSSDGSEPAQDTYEGLTLEQSMAAARARVAPLSADAHCV